MSFSEATSNQEVVETFSNLDGIGKVRLLSLPSKSTNQLVTCGSDGEIRVFDSADELKTLQSINYHDGSAINAIDTHVDAEKKVAYIVSGGEDRKICLFKKTDGEEEAFQFDSVLARTNGCIYDVILFTLPSSSSVYTAVCGEFTDIKIINLNDIEDIITLQGHTAPVKSLCVSPCMQYLLSCSISGMIKMHKIEAVPSSTSKDPDSSLTPSPSLALSAVLTQPHTLKTVNDINNTNYMYGAGFSRTRLSFSSSSSMSLVAIPTPSQVLLMMERESDRAWETIGFIKEAGVSTCAFSPCNNYVAVAVSSSCAIVVFKLTNDDGSISMEENTSNSATNNTYKTLPVTNIVNKLDLSASPSAVTSLQWLNKETIVFVNDDGYLKKWKQCVTASVSASPASIILKKSAFDEGDMMMDDALFNDFDESAILSASKAQKASSPASSLPSDIIATTVDTVMVEEESIVTSNGVAAVTDAEANTNAKADAVAPTPTSALASVAVLDESDDESERMDLEGKGSDGEGSPKRKNKRLRRISDMHKPSAEEEEEARHMREMKEDEDYRNGARKMGFIEKAMRKDRGLDMDNISDEAGYDGVLTSSSSSVPAFKLQDPFQSGATPLKSSSDQYKKRRYLAWNGVGSITSKHEGTYHNIEVLFSDTNNRKPVRLNDHYHFTMGALGEHGVVFASPTHGEAGDPDYRPSVVFYRPLDAWAQNSDWTVHIQNDENVTCIAIGESWVAVATSKHYLRVFSHAGRQMTVMCLEGPVVSMVGRGDSLVIVHYSSAVTSGITAAPLQMMMKQYDIKRRAKRYQGVLALSSTTSTLKWLHLSEQGMIMTLDSDGIVRGLSSYYDKEWIPLLDTTLLVKQNHYSKRDRFWPITEIQGKLLVVVCKGTKKVPAVFPKPVPTLISLQIPFQLLERKDVILQEEHLRETLMVQEERMQHSNVSIELEKQKKLDKKVVHLIDKACKDDKDILALDLCTLLQLPKSISISIKLATKFRKPALAERMNLILKSKTRQVREEVRRMNVEMGHGRQSMRMQQKQQDVSCSSPASSPPASAGKSSKSFFQQAKAKADKLKLKNKKVKQEVEKENSSSNSNSRGQKETAVEAGESSESEAEFCKSETVRTKKKRKSKSKPVEGDSDSDSDSDDDHAKKKRRATSGVLNPFAKKLI